MAGIWVWCTTTLMTTTELRIATQNIWHNEWSQTPARNRAVALAHMYATLDIDILLVQESVYEGTTTTARLMADVLGWNMVGASPFSDEPSSNAVLTHFPTEFATDQPSAPPEGSDFATSALVYIPELGVLHATSAHLHFGPDGGWQRLRQVAAIDDVAAKYEYAVLGMDGNSLPHSEPIRFLTGLTSFSHRTTLWLDTWDVTNLGDPGFTQDPSMPGVITTAVNFNPSLNPHALPSRRIDYLMVRGWRYGASHLGPISSVLVEPGDSSDLSDHRGVLGTFSR